MSKIKEAIELLGMFDLECSACGIIDHLTAELKDCHENVAIFNKGWEAAKNGEPKGDREDEEEQGWMVFMFDKIQAENKLSEERLQTIKEEWECYASKYQDEDAPEE